MQNKRVVAVDNVLIHRFEDEAVLLNLNNEIYYSLNITGYMMWQVLTTADNVQAALDVLSKQYNVDKDILRQDMEEFIEQLVKIGLVEVIQVE